MKTLHKASLPIIILAAAFLSPRFASAGVRPRRRPVSKTCRIETDMFGRRAIGNGRVIFIIGYRVAICMNAAAITGLRITGNRPTASGITPRVIGSSWRRPITLGRLESALRRSTRVGGAAPGGHERQCHLVRRLAASRRFHFDSAVGRVDHLPCPVVARHGYRLPGLLSGFDRDGEMTCARLFPV